MSSYGFTSAFATQLDEYLAFKKNMGFYLSLIHICGGVETEHGGRAALVVFGPPGVGGGLARGASDRPRLGVDMLSLIHI